MNSCTSCLHPPSPHPPSLQPPPLPPSPFKSVPVCKCCSRPGTSSAPSHENRYETARACEHGGYAAYPQAVRTLFSQCANLTCVDVAKWKEWDRDWDRDRDLMYQETAIGVDMNGVITLRDVFYTRWVRTGMGTRTSGAPGVGDAVVVPEGLGERLSDLDIRQGRRGEPEVLTVDEVRKGRLMRYY